MKSIDELQDIIKKVARYELAILPTPLIRLNQISSELQVELYMKRDDMTGMEFGGNKTRKLEFVWPDLMESNVDYVVTGASIQSNWCRQVAAACAQTGKHAILYLYGKELPVKDQGNLLLDRLFGAEIHMLKLEQDENMYQGMERTREIVKKRMNELESHGNVCRYIKVGAPNPCGHIAYTAAMLELVLQLKDKLMSLDDLDYIVTPVGSGGTMVGLLVANKILGSKVKILGISTSNSHGKIEEKILDACFETAKYLGVNLEFTDAEIYVDTNYCGQYGIPNDRSNKALEYVARHEGVLLDPVYSAKAMAGMLDYIAKGNIEKHSRIVFWHTGGLPAMFSDDMA